MKKFKSLKTELGMDGESNPLMEEPSGDPQEYRMKLLKMIWNWLQIHLCLVLPHNGELIMKPVREPESATFIKERNLLMELLSLPSATTPRSVARHFAVPNIKGLVGEFLTDEWESVLPLRDGNDALPDSGTKASAESDWDPTWPPLLEEELDDSVPHGKWRSKLPGGGVATGSPIGVVPDHRLRSRPDLVARDLADALGTDGGFGGEPFLMDNPLEEPTYDPVSWNPIVAAEYYPDPSKRLDAFEQ